MTLRVGAPTITGNNPADFLLGSNTCSSGLAPNASCLIGVSFKPAAAGSRSAVLHCTALQIPSNSADLVSVNLSGTGIAAIYSLSVSPGSIDFGNQPTEFAIGTDKCSGRLLAVHESCATSFRFTPATSGSRNAILSVNSSSL